MSITSDDQYLKEEYIVFNNRDYTCLSANVRLQNLLFARHQPNCTLMFVSKEVPDA